MPLQIYVTYIKYIDKFSYACPENKLSASKILKKLNTIQVLRIYVTDNVIIRIQSILVINVI